MQLSRVNPEYHPQIKKILTALIELLTMQESDEAPSKKQGQE